MNVRADAAVVADIFSAHPDPELLNIELQNERCRRAGLPARWWLYSDRKIATQHGWCDRKKFIEGSTGIFAESLDWVVPEDAAQGWPYKSTWRERLVEANVCVVHTDQFFVIDVDTKDIEQLRAALAESTKDSRVHRHGWNRDYAAVKFDDYIATETPRGYHIYAPKWELPVHLRRDRELGCRRLSGYPIDLKWSGIVVTHGSEVDGITYRKKRGLTAPWWWFVDLMELPGENLERYPLEQ